MKYFTMQELTVTKTGLWNVPNAEQRANLERLVSLILDPARAIYGKPITVTSGFRSVVVNKAVGGVPRSQHLQGLAADITAEEMELLWKVLTELCHDQLIWYKRRNFIHVSISAEGKKPRKQVIQPPSLPPKGGLPTPSLL